MRIGFFVPYLDPRPAGVGIYVDEIGRRLCARFPQTLVYTPRPEVLPEWLHPSQLRALPIGLPAVGFAGAQRRFARLAWLGMAARQAMVRDQVDVFFSPAPEAPFSLRIPSVMVIHDLTVLRYPRAYQRATVLQTRHLLPRMARHVTRLIAVSQNTKADLVSDFGIASGKIDVVGEGFDVATFFPRTEDAVKAVRRQFGLVRPYLFYAGTLSRHKNLSLILSALSHMKSQPGLEFVVAGRRDVGIGVELEAEAARLGVGDRFRSLGYVTRDELAGLMSGCAAFVYPSRYEGFGLAPLEAMACGAPVVASEVASLPEVVGSGGLLIPEGQGWASAIDRVLSEPRGQWRDRAVLQASRFDWEVAVDGIVAVLRRVTGAVA